MKKPNSDDFASLESEVEDSLTSEAPRERLLDALSANRERFDNPRRFELSRVDARNRAAVLRRP